MKAKVKARWVAALRSGDYKQGVCRLATDDKFCCFGVLCELSKLPYKGNDILPDIDVRTWSGVNFLPWVIYEGNSTSLPYLNDKVGLTFPEIADIIEAQL